MAPAAGVLPLLLALAASAAVATTTQEPNDDKPPTIVDGSVSKSGLDIIHPVQIKGDASIEEAARVISRLSIPVDLKDLLGYLLMESLQQQMSSRDGEAILEQTEPSNEEAQGNSELPPQPLKDAQGDAVVQDGSPENKPENVPEANEPQPDPQADDQDESGAPVLPPVDEERNMVIPDSGPLHQPVSGVAVLPWIPDSNVAESESQQTSTQDDHSEDEGIITDVAQSDIGQRIFPYSEPAQDPAMDNHGESPAKSNNGDDSEHWMRLRMRKWQQPAQQHGESMDVASATGPGDDVIEGSTEVEPTVREDPQQQPQHPQVPMGPLMFPARPPMGAAIPPMASDQQRPAADEFNDQRQYEPRPFAAFPPPLFPPRQMAVPPMPFDQSVAQSELPYPRPYGPAVLPFQRPYADYQPARGAFQMEMQRPVSAGGWVDTQAPPEMMPPRQQSQEAVFEPFGVQRADQSAGPWTDVNMVPPEMIARQQEQRMPPYGPFPAQQSMWRGDVSGRPQMMPNDVVDDSYLPERRQADSEEAKDDVEEEVVPALVVFLRKKGHKAFHDKDSVGIPGKADRYRRSPYPGGSSSQSSSSSSSNSGPIYFGDGGTGSYSSSQSSASSSSNSGDGLPYGFGTNSAFGGGNPNYLNSAAGDYGTGLGAGYGSNSYGGGDYGGGGYGGGGYGGGDDVLLSRSGVADAGSPPFSVGGSGVSGGAQGVHSSASSSIDGAGRVTYSTYAGKH